MGAVGEWKQSRRAVFGLIVMSAAVISMTLASQASAAPPVFWQECETDNAPPGQECRFPHGIAPNPENGHLFVSDRSNARVIELTAWGVFTRAWGWDVVESGPGNTGTGFEVCVPADGDVCKAGVAGSGVGQLSAAWGMALDSVGDVYVADHNNRRVQKFSPEGEFELMFGGEVNKTTSADTCTKADLEGGDECGIGITGTGPGEFGVWALGDTIEIDTKGSEATADDEVWIGEDGRIQRFDTAGAHQGELEIAGEKVRSLALDSGGFPYAAYEGDDIFKLDPETATVLESFEIPAPDEFTDPHARSVAVDPLGDVYAFSDASTGNGFVPLERIFKFDPGGNVTESFGKEEFGNFTGLATNLCEGSDEPGSLYAARIDSGVSYIRAYGTAPLGCEIPPPKAPAITDQYAVSVGTDNALVGARIAPRFIPGVTYYVEYGTAPCATGGCEARLPLTGAEALGGGITNDPVAATPLLLGGLQPGTTFHYRFVAESSGGGPEYGQRPVGEEEAEGSATPEAGLEASFTTSPETLPARTDCPNQALRNGPSAPLPDCRAFEMVSPVGKNGGGIETLAAGGSTDVRAAYDQSAADGDGLTFSAKTSFGSEALGAPYSSQYLSRRGSAGWLTGSLNAPHEGFPGGIGATAFDNEYKAFSPDLAEAWMIHQANPPLAPCAPENSSVLYWRETASEEYEALHCRPNKEYAVARSAIELLGVSADGCRTVFRSNSKLTEDAGEGGDYQLYESSCETPPSEDGPLRLVSRLPDESLCEVEATAGSIAGADDNNGRGKLVWNAFSADAHRLYWTCGGTLYLRSDPDLALEGDETTVQVAAPVPVLNLAPQFLTASPDGSRMLYTAAGPGLSSDYRLLSYDAESGESEEIAKGMKGSGRRVDLLGAGEDATRAYFASTEVLSAEPNSEGDVALEGEPNLFLHDAGDGSFTFVGTLGPDDLKVGPRPPSPIYPRPYHRAARVSPDGRHAAFISTAPLTGFDNRDLKSGEADAEVFRFDAEANGGAGETVCVSCNPTGARPQGRKLGGNAVSDSLWAVAWLPGWQSQLYQGNPLSADGQYVFFNSFEALVDRDTNGRQDVYQWRQAAGAGECEAQGAERYVVASGGCLSLISGGQDPEDSEFVDADPSGGNVFIRTAQSLVARDPGLLDIYDVRVNGGFPVPEAPRPGCEGQACQSPPGAPEFANPSSSAFQGPANPAAAPDCRASARRARAFARRAKALRRSARRARGASKSAKAARRFTRRSARSARRARSLSRKAKRCRARRRAANRNGGAGR